RVSSAATNGGSASGAAIFAADSLKINAPNLMNSGSITAANGIQILADAINNNGLVQSQSGNVDINKLSSSLQKVSITSTAQSAIKALNGNISVSTAGDANQKTALSIQGGQLLGNSLTLDAGCGDLSVHLDDVSGATKVTAGSADLQVADGSHGMNIT